MKWHEMSNFQRILFVAGWICVAAWFLLAILDETGVLKSAIAIRHGLFGVWCLGTGITQKSKKMRILWFVLAAAYVILSMLYIVF